MPDKFFLSLLGEFKLFFHSICYYRSVVLSFRLCDVLKTTILFM